MKSSSREALDGYLFILPWIIGFVFLLGGPILLSLLLSFCEWNGLGGFPAMRWVGLDNFRQAAGDGRFTKSVYNTFIYTAASVPLSMAGSILLALLLNQKFKGIRFFRTVFYLPAVTGGAASAFLWFYIFQPEYGLLNYSLGHLAKAADLLTFHAFALDFKGPNWLVDPAWVKSAYVGMGLWGVGGGMIIYLAGLQGIPEQLYEAAEIDGAGSWRKFIHVTLPMLSPVIFFNLILSVIGSFQIFTQAYLLSGGNGSPADAALFYVLYVYQQAFGFHRFGYASALAWMLFLIILLVTLIQFRYSRWVYYEAETRN